jgi:hypothetical protein
MKTLHAQALQRWIFNLHGSLFSIMA